MKSIYTVNTFSTFQSFKDTLTKCVINVNNRELSRDCLKWFILVQLYYIIRNLDILKADTSKKVKVLFTLLVNNYCATQCLISTNTVYEDRRENKPNWLKLWRRNYVNSYQHSNNKQRNLWDSLLALFVEGALRHE